MEQSLKQLLLKDLCARLPYGLKCKICLDEYCGWNTEYDKILADAAKVRPELPSEIREKTYTLYGIEGTRAILLEFEDHGYGVPIEFIKPFLRTIYSMTEKELEELNEKYGSIAYFFIQKPPYYHGLQAQHSDIGSIEISEFSEIYDWLNARHFDVRNLIERGLAIDCTELNIY